MTSVAIASALPPLSVSSPASDWRRSTRRAPSTTVARSAERSRAVASPSPLLAPVMTTTFPAMLPLIERAPLLGMDSRDLHIVLDRCCSSRGLVLLVGDVLHPLDYLAVE